jgi:hypothetical protein
MSAIRTPSHAAQVNAATTSQADTKTETRAADKAHFSVLHRGTVSFAHARLAHLQGQARSANARRLAKALAKRQAGKAATTRFATSTRKSGATHAGSQSNRSAERNRNPQQRVTRDGGGRGGGGGGGGQPRDGQQKQQQDQHQRQPHGDASSTSFDAAAKTRTHAADLKPLFARTASIAQGAQRADALARIWCDAILGASHGPQQHARMQQLRELRERAGALPLATLGAVRQQMMDAASRVAPNASATHANLLAPLLALLAGMPMRQRAEQQAANVNASLFSAVRTQTPQGDAI